MSRNATRLERLERSKGAACAHRQLREIIPYSRGQTPPEPEPCEACGKVHPGTIFIEEVVVESRAEVEEVGREIAARDAEDTPGEVPPG